MPGPLRSTSRPWGLDKLPDKAQAHLEQGNRILVAALLVLSFLEHHHVPYLIENPLTSILWCLPEIRHLCEQPHVRTVHTHMCQWGTRWKKATRFLASRLPVDLVDALGRRCRFINKVCSATGEPHVHLTGSSRGGAFKTKQGQEYPPALARQLAKILASGAAHYLGSGIL